MADDPLIPSRAECLELLRRIAAGEVLDHDVLPDGRVVQVPASRETRLEAQRALGAIERAAPARGMHCVN